MKSLYEHLIETMNESGMGTAQKWLGNSKNHKEFAKKFNMSQDLVAHAFGWIEEVMDDIIDEQGFGGFGDFCHEDAPDNYPEYAAEEFNEDELQNVTWTEFFDTVWNELKKFY